MEVAAPSDVVEVPEERHQRHNPPHDLISAGQELGSRWVVREKIGGGGFGQIYVAVPTSATDGGPGEVGVKVERVTEERESLSTEARVLRACQSSAHFPRFYHFGQLRGRGLAFVVMELLSCNLSEIRRQLLRQRLGGNSLRRVGLQCVDALADLHAAGFVHRDVKPSNWAMGLGPADARVVKLIDFGLARKWRAPDGSVKEARRDPGFRGTVRYASVRAHHGQDLGRCDDLESLWYMLIEMGSAGLPWRRQKAKDEIKAAKTGHSAAQLVALVKDVLPADASDTRKALRRFHDALHPFAFATEPNYSRLKVILAHGLPAVRPPLDWELPHLIRGN